MLNLMLRKLRYGLYMAINVKTKMIVMAYGKLAELVPTLIMLNY
jgi:hypothetical protein